MPEAVPLQPRRDVTAADADTLVALGRLDPQPIPKERPAPGPPSNSTDQAEAAALTAALADAGIETGAGDQAAVLALASLDAATVETVKAWLKKTKGNAPSK